MYEQDYNMDDENMEKIKKIIADIKKLEMTKYIEQLENRRYPPDENTYAE